MSSVLMVVWNFIVKLFKKYWKEILVVAVIAGLAITASIYIKKYNKSAEEVSEYAQNNKALIDQLSSNKNNLYELKLEMSDLRYINDSVTQKLAETVDKLDLKDKQVKYLQYLYTHFERKDSIVVEHDTIFRDADFYMDTVIGDAWMSTEVQLKYPNIICVSPNVKSQKSVVIYSKREPIRPSKSKFINFFRKKHTVTKVYINEENPYIESQDNMFINTSK